MVLMGPPGAGKGTQGEILEERLGIPRYATGDMLRLARRKGTPLGRQAQRFMDAGELVPDQVVLGIVRDVLSEQAGGDGFILDGFPRTVAQAEGLRRILDELDARLDAVINISVDDEEIAGRLTDRRICESCGLVVGPDAAAEDTCPECEGRLVQRRDDSPGTVRRRLEVYRDRMGTTRSRNPEVSCASA